MGAIIERVGHPFAPDLHTHCRRFHTSIAPHPFYITEKKLLLHFKVRKVLFFNLLQSPVNYRHCEDFLDSPLNSTHLSAFIDSDWEIAAGVGPLFLIGRRAGNGNQRKAGAVVANTWFKGGLQDLWGISDSFYAK